MELECNKERECAVLKQKPYLVVGTDSALILAERLKAGQISPNIK